MGRGGRRPHAGGANGTYSSEPRIRDSPPLRRKGRSPGTALVVLAVIFIITTPATITRSDGCRLQSPRERAYQLLGIGFAHIRFEAKRSVRESDNLSPSTNSIAPTIGLGPCPYHGEDYLENATVELVKAATYHVATDMYMSRDGTRWSGHEEPPEEVVLRHSAYVEQLRRLNDTGYGLCTKADGVMLNQPAESVCLAPSKISSSSVLAVRVNGDSGSQVSLSQSEYKDLAASGVRPPLPELLGVR